MLSDLECPQCKHEHDMSNHPDWHYGLRNNRFWFTCNECGAEFEVDVDWEPFFFPLADTVVSQTKRVT